MKCYNHHDRDAFGICSVCGKGLCLECMNTKNDKVVCNDSNCLNILTLKRILSVILFIAVFAALLVLIFD